MRESNEANEALGEDGSTISPNLLATLKRLSRARDPQADRDALQAEGTETDQMRALLIASGNKTPEECKQLTDEEVSDVLMEVLRNLEESLGSV